MSKKEFDAAKLRQVQEWLLQGQLITDILTNIIRKWGITENEAMNYVSASFDDFAKKSGRDYAKTKAYIFQLTLNLYKKAVEDKNYAVAQRVLKDLRSMEGID